MPEVITSDDAGLRVALIPEPGRETLTRANLGVLWFEFEVRGVPVHVACMGAGANAIDAAYRVISALRELEKKWNIPASAFLKKMNATHVKKGS